uniref:Uncharacterized protein n=1 Tax=Aliivibrio wodanis TaxID=80852 RepID=A0A5Q4ZV67_9GAMM|nr:hypothetical protein AW0309160_01412 [Aliivibrio wodanis]
MSDSTNEISEEEFQDAKVVRKIYSPTQVACSTVGGPIGLIYFLASNFSTLNDEELKNKTIKYGIALIVVLIIILPLLPDDVSSLPFTIFYIVVGRYVSEKYQMKKVDIESAEEFDFHSNWRVLGLSLLCLIGSIVVLLGPIFILIALGIL